MKKVITLVLSTMMAATLLTSCNKSTSPAATSAATAPATTSAATSTAKAPAAGGDTLVITGSNALTDVIGTVWNDTVGLYLDQIFGKLVQLDLHGNPVPQLAKEWKLSDDHLTYTFTLADNVKWHDGQAFTADDVTWSMKTFLKAAVVNGLIKKQFLIIKGAQDYADGKAQDISGLTSKDNTVTMELSKVSTAFLPTLALFSPLPKHLLEKEDPKTIDKSSFWSMPIGTGPYKIKEWNKNNYLLLTRFENYYGAKPNIPNIKVLVVKSPEDQLKGMLAGEIPYGYFSDVTQAAQVIASDKKFKAQEISSGYIRALRANLNGKGANNTKGNPIVEDPNVRLALMMAINKQELSDTVMGKMATPASSVISTSDPSYNAEAFKDLTYNPTKAKQMLIDAKFDFNKELTVASAYSVQNAVDVVNGVVGYWSAIGVKAKVSIPATGTSIIDFIYNTRDFDFIYQADSYAASSPADAYGFFIPDGTYSEKLNAKFGQAYVPIMDKFYTEFNPAKRTELVKELQTLESKTMLCLPLFELKQYAIYDTTKLKIPQNSLTYDNDGFYRGLDKWELIK